MQTRVRWAVQQTAAALFVCGLERHLLHLNLRPFQIVPRHDLGAQRSQLAEALNGIVHIAWLHVLQLVDLEISLVHL